MINKAITKPSDVLEKFASRNIPIAFFCPTDTALKKSIIDATFQIRDLLKKHSIHDYEKQNQGEKKYVQSFFIERSGTHQSKTSLYRPETKNGDPRFWPYRFKGTPWNLYGVIPFNGEIYYLNCSDEALIATIDNPESTLGKIAVSFKNSISDIASELLSNLKDISSRGYIESMRSGDTGVGYTLETLLGIEENNSPSPDYKGIEIKTNRVPSKGRSGSRSTLFSKTPNWEISPLSAKEVLYKCGYYVDGRLQLYTSLTASKFNSLNMSLEVLNNENYVASTVQKNSSIEKIMLWDYSALYNRLLEKHNETFWVKAKTKVINGKEYFFYHEIIHSRKPCIENFFYLIEDGTIEIDLTMSLKNKRVKDHGYMFKIWPKDLKKLIPINNTYSLI